MDTNFDAIYMDEFKPVGYLNERKNFLKVLTNHLHKITELRKKNKELHKITETQKGIISILAHDVRSPLNSIKSIIELKKTDLIDSEDASELMGRVTGQINNTIEMVENVVMWGQSRLQTDGSQIADVDLHALVQRIFVSESLKSLAKNNKLENTITPGITINSDENALEFILRNLISNANKFTENGVITVNLEQKDFKYLLSVTDTGVGMTEEQIENLLNNKTKSTPGTRNEKGSGIGLLLIKEFVSRLNGSLKIESKIGEGASFIIVL